MGHSPKSDMSILAAMLVHAEDGLVSQSLVSFLDSVELFRLLHPSVRLSTALLCDNPSSFMSDVFFPLNHHLFDIVEFSDFRDQGAAKNNLCSKYNEIFKYISFMDGDDHWSENWLSKCYEFTLSCPRDDVVLIPELVQFVGGSHNTFRNLPSRVFPSLKYMKLFNLYDAMNFMSMRLLDMLPYPERAIKNGYAYEDWHWALQGLKDNILEFVVVSDTYHIKTRRARSQTIVASATQTIYQPIR